MMPYNNKWYYGCKEVIEVEGGNDGDGMDT
jgi:hypothetical protein